MSEVNKADEATAFRVHNHVPYPATIASLKALNYSRRRNSSMIAVGVLDQLLHQHSF